MNFPGKRNKLVKLKKTFVRFFWVIKKIKMVTLSYPEVCKPIVWNSIFRAVVDEQ